MRIRLWSRPGQGLKATQAVVDGEIVAIDANGSPPSKRFNIEQHTLSM
jgi:hypothetical protein